MEHFITNHPILCWVGSGFLTWLVMSIWEACSPYHGYDNSNVDDFPPLCYMMCFMAIGPVPAMCYLVYGLFYLDIILLAVVLTILGLIAKNLLALVGLRSLSAKILPNT